MDFESIMKITGLAAMFVSNLVGVITNGKKLFEAIQETKEIPSEATPADTQATEPTTAEETK